MPGAAKEYRGHGRQLHAILQQWLKVCGDWEDWLLHGILLPSPSCTEEPLGRSGAGIAEHVERRRDAGAKAQSYTELNLILVVFL